jgi:hypothetical protein
MKKQHILASIVGILIILGLIALPNITRDEPAANEFVGTWETGGENAEGERWWMIYEITNDSYTLTTDSGYGEEGTYEIGEQYLDGSAEFVKTYLNGTKTHTMVIVPTEDPDQKKIDGVLLQRTTQE